MMIRLKNAVLKSTSHLKVERKERGFVRGLSMRFCNEKSYKCASMVFYPGS